MQAWCQKDLPTLYQRRTGWQTHVMWTPRDHLDYRRRDNIQRAITQNNGRAKAGTTLRLEECDFGHALGARTFYTKFYKRFFSIISEILANKKSERTFETPCIVKYSKIPASKCLKFENTHRQSNKEVFFSLENIFTSHGGYAYKKCVFTSFIQTRNWTIATISSFLR